MTKVGLCPASTKNLGPGSNTQLKGVRDTSAVGWG